MLTRQQSLEAFQDPQKQQQSQACQFCMLAPAICAVVIAAEYSDYSPCGDSYTGSELLETGPYTVDLVTYLQVAGYLTIAWTGLVIFCTCIGKCSSSDESQIKLQQALLAPACCFLLFNLAWAAVGLYIWDNEMSQDCQDSHVGSMILAWGVIQYSLMGIVCICLCLAMFCFGTAMAINIRQQ